MSEVGENGKVAEEVDTSEDVQLVAELSRSYEQMTEQLGKVIVGQSYVIEQV